MSIAGPVVAQEAAIASLPTVAARDDGILVLVDLAGIARVLGASRTDGGTVFTVRGANGVLTVFDGDPDALWQTRGADAALTVPLSGPVRHDGAAWFVPSDALAYLDLRVEARGDENVLVDPTGPVMRLVRPRDAGGREVGVVPLAEGVDGLRFAIAGADGTTVSLLLVDVALLPLLHPDLRAGLDAALAERPLGGDRLLAFVATASAPTEWDARLVFRQGDAALDARHPFRLRVLSGDPKQLGPETPAIGVVSLPEAFRLDRPLDVSWAGQSARIVFRR